MDFLFSIRGFCGFPVFLEGRLFAFGFIQMHGIEHAVKLFEFPEVDFIDSEVKGGGYMFLLEILFFLNSEYFDAIRSQKQKYQRCHWNTQQHNFQASQKGKKIFNPPSPLPFFPLTCFLSSFATTLLLIYYILQINGYPMQKKKCYDRFISQVHPTTFKYPLPAIVRSQCEPTENYQNYLLKEMFSSQSNLEQELRQKMNPQKNKIKKEKHFYRTIPSTPEKVLDAPDIKDDYYLNLLDWSSKGVLAIGLTEKVYLYSTKQITELCDLPEDEYVCSLSYHPEGSLLSVGLTNGNTDIYDIQKQTVVRTLEGHTKRVSSSAFTYGLLYTGSRDSTICAHDYRCDSNVVLKMQGHRGEVCGLKHDSCGLASGSNDNMSIIWDINMGRPRNYLLGHKAAVKALAWCPWQRNLLATGGGSADKTLRLWNIETGKMLKEINTQSQVCSLLWNSEQKQLVSSHGYVENQLCVWKVNKSALSEPSCKKIAQLYGHTQRVLHMAQSPDNSTICTASADETLRFWKLFDKESSLCMVEGEKGKDSLEECTLR